MAKYFNITGVLTQELLAAGDNIKTSSIWLTNIHASDAVVVDLYIEKQLTGKFYLLKNYSIATAKYLFLENINFSNSLGEFGLYIKLNASDSAVDIIIR
jgi:thermostable 8-oxoguanine DNA glycosylase